MLLRWVPLRHSFIIDDNWMQPGVIPPELHDRIWWKTQAGTGCGLWCPEAQGTQMASWEAMLRPIIPGVLYIPITVCLCTLMHLQQYLP